MIFINSCRVVVRKCHSTKAAARIIMLASAFVFASGRPACAVINLEEGITPATDWPEAVNISTGDPGVNTTGVSVTTSHVISQTITPASTIKLSAVYFSYSTSADSIPGSFAVRIQQVAGGAGVQTYTQGTNLLSSGNFIFPLASTGGTIKLMKFVFTGPDQLTLTAGVTYAVEITSTSSNVTFYRRGADTYSGGCVYDNRSAINYPSTRDLAMAVVSTVGASNGVTVIEGITPSNIWPEPATITTATPGNNSVGVTANASNIASQTFTPGTNYNLGAIYFSYITNATSGTNSFTVSVQKVPEGNAAQTYAAGSNLLGTVPLTFGLDSTGGAVQLMKIELSGTYQIPLTAGTTYAVEIAASGTSSVTFLRSGANTYAGGSAYVNRSAINYPNTRDLAMAVVESGGADPGSGGTAGTSYLAVPQSFGIQLLDGNVPTDGEKNQVVSGGFKFFRKGVYWSKVETTKGVYGFSYYDGLINGLIAKGLTPYITLFSGNSLYGETQNQILTGTGRAGFANFAAAVASHYTQANYFEVWNEPNNSFFWVTQPSVQAYCQLVAAVAPAVKTARPSAKIVGPALAGPNIDYNWLEQAFQNGLLNNIDCLAVHPYRPASSPPETVLPEYQQVRAYIQQYAPAGKQIAILGGEWGYHTDTTTSGTTPDVQAQYAARMFLIEMSIGMPFYNWYQWIDGSSDPTSTDHYGLFDTTKAAKPSYTAFQTISTVLSGYAFQQAIPYIDKTVYVFKFANSSGKVAYALWTTGSGGTIQVPLPAGSGTVYSIYGTPQTLSWSAGGPNITVSQAPQYLLVN